MAYYRAKSPPEEAPTTPSFPGRGEIWDTVTAPFAGLLQGLVGKNLNWKQYIRERAKKRRGGPPGTFPGRGPMGWLSRVLTGQ